MDAALSHAFEATWPAAEYADAGGFRVGRGFGAGGRVSSARAVGAWTSGDITRAEAIHRGWGQRPMFRALDSDAALIAALTGAGYQREAPTAIMSAPVAALTGKAIPPVTTFAVWPPLAIQRDLWRAGNISDARQAVMMQAGVPKAAILGRTDDRAAGAAFVAVSDDVALVHAVEVLPEFRRRGLAGWMMRQAALWAADHGASRIALAVSRANTGARMTYDSMGFAEVTGYGYYAKS